MLAFEPTAKKLKMPQRDSPTARRDHKSEALPSNDEELQRLIDTVKEKLNVYEGENQETSPKYSDEERARVKELFEIFDRNHSGDIDAEEFQDLAYHLGETITVEEAAALIELLDTNKDGKVDFEEFFTWWRSKENT